MRQLVAYFFGLGWIGFGGPAALVARMEHDLVERRHWLTRDEYLEGLAVCQTLPGPLAIQVSIYVGYVRRVVLGAWASGGAFMLPPFVIVLASAYLYQRFSALTAALFLFFLKAGLFTFGSGLVIVPFLREGVVTQQHWLTERDFMVAVARSA